MIDETRRNILKTGFIGAVAGSTVISGLGGLCKVKEAKAKTAEHPYGYPVGGLDVQTTRQLAYDCWYGTELEGITHKGCAFATFHAIISQLAELDPNGPYSEIPTQMLEWAAGGVAGYGSICGTLNGACAAIGLICANGEATELISKLLNWSAESNLPTTPTEYDVFKDFDIMQSIAGGHLCHMSVTNWCLASGKAIGSDERKERCARLAADVAGTVIAVLNKEIGLEDTAPVKKTVCGSCHTMGTDYDAGQFTLGKMDCTACHTDLKKVGEEGHYLSLIKKPE